MDPNETLNTLIAFNKEKLDDGNPNYKYLEIDTKFIFGALHSIIPFSNHDPYVRNLWCLAQQASWYGDDLINVWIHFLMYYIILRHH